MEEKANIADTEGPLAIGISDVVEDIPLELQRVMTHNSRELEQLPREHLVNVPDNRG